MIKTNDARAKKHGQRRQSRAPLPNAKTLPSKRSPASVLTPAKARKSAHENTKVALVVASLRSPKGASIADLCKATGWQPHSARGALSGAIKKRLGLAVTSEKVDGVRRYRLAN